MQERERETGTSGSGDPDVWKGTETKEKDGLDNMDWTKGNLDCRAGREEKCKSVAERLRERAEKIGTVEVEAETGLKGRARVSATTFSEPWTWTISLVNSEM